MTTLPISVIVCVRNRAAVLGECLDSIVVNNPAEIIVVDGDSTDDTRAIANCVTTLIYSDDGRGLAYARQLGAHKASQPFIAYVDSDVTLPQGTLARMLDELQNWGFAGIHAQMLGAEMRNYWERAQDKHFRLTFNRPGARAAIGMVTALFDRNVILEHPFDPYFTGASEDGDISARIRQAGYKLGVSTAHIYHKHRADFRGFVKQRLWYGEGNARLALKRRSLSTLVGPVIFPLYGIARSLANRDPSLILYFLVNGVVTGAGIAKGLMTAIPRPSRKQGKSKNG